MSSERLAISTLPSTFQVKKIEEVLCALDLVGRGAGSRQLSCSRSRVAFTQSTPNNQRLQPV